MNQRINQLLPFHFHLKNNIDRNTTPFSIAQNSSPIQTASFPPQQKHLLASTQIPNDNIINDLPTLEDLYQPTNLQDNFEIQALASKLNYDAISIYNYLQHNIQFSPYSGLRKGAWGVL